MDLAHAFGTNLLSPAVLFFGLGLAAAVVKTDLKFPEPLHAGLTLYLLVAIGFKGGVAIAEAGLARVWLPALAAMALGALIPLSSLAITFPFNLALGIPIQAEFARRLFS